MTTSLDTGADFSIDRLYRYRLWRIWDAARPRLVWIMLNPSTADATANDPTIRQCLRRAKELNYGGIVVVNLFALCATQPRDMKRHSEPIGRDNDDAILEAAREAVTTRGTIICAWGTHGGHRGRSRVVITRLQQLGYPLYCLGMTETGEPRHPLFVPAFITLQPIPSPIQETA